MVVRQTTRSGHGLTNMEQIKIPLSTFALHTAITLALAGLSGGALYAVADYATRGVVV